MAGLGQALLERHVVLDDAVVDDHELARTVAVGVGVLLGGLAVGGPAGVSQGHDARQGRLLQDRVEVGQLAGRAAALDRAALGHGHAGRVIAPVLEALEAFQDERRGLPAPRVADDAAHRLAQQDLHLQDGRLEAHED